MRQPVRVVNNGNPTGMVDSILVGAWDFKNTSTPQEQDWRFGTVIQWRSDFDNDAGVNITGALKGSSAALKK